MRRLWFERRGLVFEIGVFGLRISPLAVQG